MALDTAYSEQTPAFTGNGDQGAGGQQKSDVTSLVSLLTQTSASREGQDRVVRGLNQLLSPDTNTSSAYLPILRLLGLQGTDTGTGSQSRAANTSMLRSGDASVTGSDRRTTATDSRLDASSGSNDRQSSDDNEPAAVSKYLAKYKPSIPGRSIDNRPDTTPDRPVQPDRPDNPRPDANVKPRYETSEIEEAVRLAKENNLPLVVHIGASWCGPCRTMEANAWPGVERDGSLNKKAIYLHIDADRAKELGGAAGDLANQIMSGVSGYPTIKVLTVGDGGTVNQVDSKSGGMAEGQLKEFIRKNLR